MGKFIKSHLVLTIITLIVIIVGSVTAFLVYHHIKENNEVIVSEKLELEINSEVKVSSLVKTAKGVKIKDKNKLVDTSKLGTKQITMKYQNKYHKNKKITFKVTITDTKKPTIESEDVININVGVEPKLTEKVKVNDNSKEAIVPKIEGDYDYNKIGEYKLKYVATDISGNKAEKDFVLKINAPQLKHTGYYLYKGSDSWEYVNFNNDGKVEIFVNYCPGSGCGALIMNGTYKTNGNKVTTVLKYMSSEEAEMEPLDSPATSEFTIIDENKLQSENHNYNWQKNR